MNKNPTAPIGTVCQTSSYAEAVLASHQCQQKSNDCGPFSAMMVINALTGRTLDPVVLARRMDRPRRRAVLGLFPLVRRWPGSATFPWGMVDILREHGLAARWRVLARPADLHAGLDRGELAIPIVGQWRPKPWAHYMVLLAHDPERGWGFADPASPNNALSWRSEAKFASQWRNYGRVVIAVRGGGASGRR